jgi:hypothetical protein
MIIYYFDKDKCSQDFLINLVTMFTNTNNIINEKIMVAPDGTLIYHDIAKPSKDPKIAKRIDKNIMCLKLLVI